jgi:AraC-like DNA-binding protein
VPGVESRTDEFLAEIAAAAAGFPEGSTQTSVPFLSVVRRSRPTPFAPAVLHPSFCLIIQGAKRVHLGRKIIDYGPGEFVTTLIDMPVSGKIVHATARRPYLGLRVDFSPQDIASVVAEARPSMQRAAKPQTAAFVGRSDRELLELLARLVRLLDRPRGAGFLASLIEREIIFRLLTSERADLFFQTTLFDPADGVGRVIDWIRQNYTSPFTVERLARSNGLSVSNLHHKFKAITTMSPVQYQKQLRLQEARRLMLGGLANATTAALQVGYESPSQFNREYRRRFGLPPRRDVQVIRANPGSLASSD